MLGLEYANTIEDVGRKEVIEIRSDAQGLLRTLERVVHVDILLNKIQQQLRIAFHAGKNIVLRWVPGHQDIYGNEFADLLAKKGVDAKCVLYMPVTIRDVQQVHKKRKLLDSESKWNDFHSTNIKAFLPDVHAVNRFISSSPTVAVCQLVSGHTRLNEFVSRILGLAESPRCKCGKDKETVMHFLFHCELYEQIRREIWVDFQPHFAFIVRDWEKLKDFVKKSRRFEGKAVKNSAERGGKRIIALHQ